MPWIPGLELSERFFHDAVEPIITEHYPHLRYSAGLIDSGSEVLGFDTEMSSDHHWGPRGLLFLRDDDHAAIHTDLHDTLATHLPYTFLGYSTHFGEAGDDPHDNSRQMIEISSGPIAHRVEIWTVAGFFEHYMRLNPRHDLSIADWLSLPSQLLRTVTHGGLFRDDDGVLTDCRQRLAFYPRDVWLYMMAAAWDCISQDEHLMPRAGFVGDAVGAKIMAGRVVHNLMKLCFLQERVYAPYHKWFGSGFKQLQCAPTLLPYLEAALVAPDWQTTEAQLVHAYEVVATQHNTLGLTAPLDTAVRSFHGRPFRVIDGFRFADALLAAIEEPTMVAVARRTMIGGIDQFSTNTTFLSHKQHLPLVRRLFNMLLTQPAEELPRF